MSNRALSVVRNRLATDVRRRALAEKRCRKYVGRKGDFSVAEVVLCLYVIADGYRDSRGYYDESEQQIADAMGLSTRTVQKCTNVLTELGYLETTLRGNPASSTRRRLTFLSDPEVPEHRNTVDRSTSDNTGTLSAGESEETPEAVAETPEEKPPNTGTLSATSPSPSISPERVSRLVENAKHEVPDLLHRLGQRHGTDTTATAIGRLEADGRTFRYCSELERGVTALAGRIHSDREYRRTQERLADAEEPVIGREGKARAAEALKAFRNRQRQPQEQ